MKDESIQVQESIDYSITRRIIGEIYGNMLTNMVKFKEYSSVDCAYTASTRGIDSHYLMEIKTVNNNWWQINGEIFQFKKYFNAKDFARERDNNERVLFIFLMQPTNEYFIWDADKINWDITPVRDVTLKKVQYQDNSEKVVEKCMFLQLEDAVAKGTYVLTEEEKQMVEYKNKLLEMGR